MTALCNSPARGELRATSLASRAMPAYKAPQIMSELRWYLHRLRAMSLPEIAGRVARSCRALTERSFLKKAATHELGALDPQQPRLANPASAPSSLRAQLAADAALLLAGRWQLFGWRQVDVGSPPCWHRDPLTGVVVAHDLPSSQLDHRHLPDGADARSIWEVNRWSEMTRLAMHGWLNDDASAIRTAQLWLEDWCDRNPAGIGINWTSPLEAALRLIQFTWFDALVTAWMDEQTARGHSLRDHQTALRRRIVPTHAAWCWRHRSSGSSANNHLLGELAALVVAVSRWPGLADIACTAEQAWENLCQEVLRQFAPDGGSLEQALHYHAFALELAWLAARTVGCKAGAAHDRLALAGRFFVAACHEREGWDYGDSDDAIVLPLALHRQNHAHELRAWLLGENGALRWWLGPPPLVAARGYTTGLVLPEWQTFASTGIAILRSHGWMARLDASPLGFGSLAAHGHSDALHVSIWDGDRAVIIDPGTGGYYGYQTWRTELATWTAHNGPLPHPQGYQTPRRIGPFLQTHHHPVPSLAVEGGTAIACLTHERHSFQRQIRRIEDGLEIQDTEDQQRPFSVCWIMPPGTQVKAMPEMESTVFLIQRDQQSWRLTLRAEHQAAVTLEERRVSPCYGKLETAPAILIQNIQTALVTTLSRWF